jgi:hypothetical protein
MPPPRQRLRSLRLKRRGVAHDHTYPCYDPTLDPVSRRSRRSISRAPRQISLRQTRRDSVKGKAQIICLGGGA